MYDCLKSRFRMMSNHIDARSWAVPTLQNDLNAVKVSITDYYPDRLLVRLEKLVTKTGDRLLAIMKAIKSTINIQSSRWICLGKFTA
jgi:hypothetical protein